MNDNNVNESESVVLSQFKSVTSKSALATDSLTIAVFLATIKDWGWEKVEKKEHASLISVSTYEFADDKGAMTRKNALCTSVVALDIDITMKDDEVKKLKDNLIQLGRAFVLHDTFSSQQNARKLRVYCPFNRQIFVEDLADITKRVAKFLGVKAIDKASYSKGQIFYVPSYKDDNELDWRLLEVSESIEPWDDDIIADVLLDDSEESKSSNSSSDKITLAEAGNQYIKSKGISGIIANNDGFLVSINEEWHHHTSNRLKSDIYKILNGAISPVGSSQVVEHLKLSYYAESFPDCPSDSLYQTNGYLLDVRTGMMLENDSQQYVLHRLDVTFRDDDTDDAYDAPIWLSFLDQTFDGRADKEELIRLLQQMMGYTLLRNLDYQTMFMLYGTGANGKSVVIKIIQYILGGENVSNVPFDQLSGKFALSSMVGKLANVSDEVNGFQKLNTETLKLLTAMTDVMVEAKGKTAQNGKHYAKLIVALNTLPQDVDDDTHGFLRRLRILPFSNTVSPDKQDVHLVDKLKQEKLGILMWMIEGAMDLVESRGFVNPESSQNLVESIKSNNAFHAFVEATGLTASTKDSDRMMTGDLYRRFELWASNNGFPARKVINNSQFGAKLKAMGVDVRKSGNNRYYRVAFTGEIPPLPNNTFGTQLQRKKISLDENDS